MSLSDLYFQFDRDRERECGGADLQRQQQRGGAHRGEEGYISDMRASKHDDSASFYYFVQVRQLSMCCLGPGYCAV